MPTGSEPPKKKRKKVVFMTERTSRFLKKHDWLVGKVEQFVPAPWTPKMGRRAPAGCLP